MHKRIIFAIAASFLFVASAIAAEESKQVELTLRTDVKPATTQPAADTFSLKVCAVEGQNFATSIVAGDRALEFNGMITETANSDYKVRIDFTDHDGRNVENISTIVILTPDREMKLAGLNDKASAHSTTVMLTPIKSQ
jgi:hypothetical protein